MWAWRTQSKPWSQNTVETYARLDYAHNNAGSVGTFNSTIEQTEADWTPIIQINLKGVCCA